MPATIETGAMMQARLSAGSRALQLQQVVIASPGGNVTALVYAPVAKEDFKKVNAYLQKINPLIEQVMFVDLSGPIPFGQMAGGEFCGNATRSLGYHLLGGENGEISLMISGTSAPLKVVVSNGNAGTEMPILHDLNSAKEIEQGLYQVFLEGIAHMVAFPEHELSSIFRSTNNTVEKKRLAFDALSQHKMLDEPASGIMVLHNQDGLYAMEPYVYVRDIDTFFAETACGSGSVAVGLALSKKLQTPIHNLPIRQPSGTLITVCVDQKDGKFGTASINGRIDILHEGAV